MRKDYIPVSLQQASVDETAFVEEFWSQRWQQVEQLPEVAFVAEREEYLFMKPFLHSLSKDDRILDGGCGMGEWTVFLTNQGFKTVGIDISQQTIDRLQELLPNHEFVRGDIRQTGFPDASFDAYFSWGTFEHFESGLGDCIKEAYRILKPGGILFSSVPYQNWRHILRDARPLTDWDLSYNRQQGYSETLRFYQWRLTMPEFEQELAIGGFELLDMRPIGRLQGLSRALVHDLHIPPGSLRDRIAKRLLPNLIPGRWIAHMILAIAQKKP